MTTQLHSDLLDGTLKAMAAYDLTRPSLILRATWLTILFGFTPAFAAHAGVKPVKPGFTVHYREVPHEPTCWHSLIGMAAEDLAVAPVTPDRRSAMNMAFGAINRIGVDNATNCQIEKYRDVIQSVLDDLFNVELEYTVMDYEHIAVWIESRPYDTYQKNALHQCLDSLCSWNKTIFEEDDNFKTKAFIKNEAYTDYKYARLICAGGPLRKILYGPLFQPLSDWFFHQNWSIKHLPHELRGQAIIDRLGTTGHFYVTDHSAFECSATTRVQELIEAQVYRKYIRSEYMPLLDYIIYGNQQGLQEIFGRNVYIETPVVRNSGEMNTSLGNSILNLVTIHTAARMLNTEVVGVLVEGDDGLFTLRDYVEPDKLAHVMSEIGMRIKVEYHKSVYTTSFCSTKISPLGVGIDWVRNFVRFPWKTTPTVNALAELQAKAGAYGLMARKSAIAKSLVQYYNSTVAWFTDDTYHREKMGLMGEQGHIEVPIPEEALEELQSPITMENLLLDAETNDTCVGAIENVIHHISRGEIAQAVNAFYSGRPMAACWEMTKNISQKLMPHGGAPGKQKFKAAYVHVKNVLNDVTSRTPQFDHARSKIKETADQATDVIGQYFEAAKIKFKEFKNNKRAQMGPERQPELDIIQLLKDTLQNLRDRGAGLLRSYARLIPRRKITKEQLVHWMIEAFTHPVIKYLLWTAVDLLFPFSVFLWIYEPYILVLMLVIYWIAPRRTRLYITIAHVTLFYGVIPDLLVIAIVIWSTAVHALAGANHYNKF